MIKPPNLGSKKNWTQRIYNNLWVQFGLMITLILAAAGYVVIHQQVTKSFNALTNEYHLKAGFHYAEAGIYLKDIQQHLLAHDKEESQLSTTNLDQHKDDFSYTATLHLALREIRYGLELQRRFSDERLTGSTERLRNYSTQLERNVKDHTATYVNGEVIQQNIKRTFETIDQLVRLHTNIRDELLDTRQGAASFGGKVFYIVLAALMALGAFIAWRSSLAIRGIVNEQKEIEGVIKHQATYDDLTDLPNRFLIIDRLTQLLYDAQRNHKHIGVLFLDLDNFKKVNDSLGHNIGDELLVETGRRLKECLRQGDSVGRLGGDEFVIVLGQISELIDVKPALNKIIQQFNKPFLIDRRELIVTASIGVSVFPNDGKDATALLQHADSAMYHSKASGRNTYTYFTEKMHQAIDRRIAVEEHMLKALELNEFEVHYQPQVEFKTGQIVGAEALLRWKNAELGNPTPDEFIPIAEQTGLIVPIGQYVIETAFAQCAEWKREHIPNFRIAINMSPRQFRADNLVENIAEQINKYLISPKNVDLEITEGVLLSGQAQVTKALDEFAKQGITLSMDDFGTGYSSLSYLRRFPFSVVKIDRSFISDINSNNMDRELIKATIAMAHSLNLKVIAEGVETQDQYQMLQQLGCDYAQGYLLGKPMAEKAFEQFLVEHEADDHSYIMPQCIIGHTSLAALKTTPRPH